MTYKFLKIDDNLPQLPRIISGFKMPPLKAMRSFPTARFQAFMSSLTWGMLLSLPENFFRV